MNIAEELKLVFRKGNTLYKLIFINVVIFLVIGLIFVIYRLFTPGITLNDLQNLYSKGFLKYLMVPSIPGELLRSPWTIVTYMFTHFNFLHILFNMLILYWFGRIFLQYLTEKQLLSTYVLGGLAGAILFIIFVNIFPGLREHLGSSMLGASAAIMAIVIAISLYVPDYTIYMLFIGPVKLKYIALGFIVLDVLMIASYNAGGHIAHLGGALYGYLFINRYKKGIDIGKWLNRLLDSFAELFKPYPKLNVTYRKAKKTTSDAEYNRIKIEQQKEIDRILDKIAKAGYESLSKKEKETLFNMSNKNK
jgi:membrane associated rhomboid family serine protease